MFVVVLFSNCKKKEELISPKDETELVNGSKNSARCTAPANQVILREHDFETGHRILEIIAMGLLDLSRDENFKRLVSEEVAKKFDEDSDVLIVDLEPKAKEIGIDLQREMQKSLIKRTNNPKDMALLNQYFTSIPVEKTRYYPQIFIPYLEKADFTKEIKVAPYYHQENVYGWEHRGSGQFEKILIHAPDETANLTMPYWIISLNERVDKDGVPIGIEIYKDPFRCGNNICEPRCGETAQNCIDCVYECGNGDCEAQKGENKDNCPEDCRPRGVCGNNICEWNENHNNCPGDCSDINVKITEFKVDKNYKYEGYWGGDLEVWFVGMVYTPQTEIFGKGGVGVTYTGTNYFLRDCHDGKNNMGCLVANVPKYRIDNNEVIHPNTSIITAWPEDADKMFLVIYEYDTWQAGKCVQCSANSDWGTFDTECGMSSGVEGYEYCENTISNRGCINKISATYPHEYWFSSCGTDPRSTIYRSYFLSTAPVDYGTQTNDKGFYVRFEWYR